MKDGNNIEIKTFFDKLTNYKFDHVDLNLLSSAQKGRFLQKFPDYDRNENETPLTNKSSEPKSTKQINSDFIGQVLIGVDIQSIQELFANCKNLDDLIFPNNPNGFFTQVEVSYASTKPNPKETLTGLFAAKEAILKCSNYEFQKVNDICFHFHDKNGPSFDGYSVSISHSGDNVVAVAVPELGIKKLPDNSQDDIQTTKIFNNELKQIKNQLEKTKSKDKKLIFCLTLTLASLFWHIANLLFK